MSNTNYTLNFMNKSNLKGDICVYQTDPNINDPTVMSLAWFSKYCTPTTRIKFGWSINYCFVWSQTGELQPGIQFDASQTWDADLTGLNTVILKKDKAAYTFDSLQKGGNPGTLYINEDSNLPSLPDASVGIGMSGKGTFVVQAHPNMKRNFTPKPQYWITFGNYIQGQVLDITEISDKAEIKFPAGVYSMTAILNEDNSWTIKPTLEVNKETIHFRR